jgi:hypothetical protein
MCGSNNDWQPGRPVITPADIAAWQAWRKARILADQRDRRGKLRRIDYYPSVRAAAIIDAHIRPCAGGDYSSVISRIVEEWAANSGIQVS